MSHNSVGAVLRRRANARGAANVPSTFTPDELSEADALLTQKSLKAISIWAGIALNAMGTTELKKMVGFFDHAPLPF